MTDWAPPNIWTADFTTDSLGIFAGDINGLRALLLLELNEEENHIPFVYPEDEWGSVKYESLLSETLILNNRSYKVIKGIYHEDIIDEIDYSINTSPWEYFEYEVAKPPHASSFWAGGADTAASLCFKYDDKDGEILKIAMDGNCYVAHFALPWRQRGFAANKVEPIYFDIKRIVQNDGKWDAIGMGISEETSFSGSSYVEPRTYKAIESIGEFVVENSLGFGTVLLLFVFLAVNRFLKRKKLTKNRSESGTT